MTDVIQLVHYTTDTDEYGDPVSTETMRQVFCAVASIGMKEFYQAQSTGLKPEVKFVLADYLEYDGETVVLYNTERYRVLRTYQNGQRLELVCYREVNDVST